VQELERALPAQTIRRLFQTEAMNAVVDADLDGIVKCHRCGFMAVFEGDGPMECPECKAATCSRCGRPWHQGVECADAKEIDNDRLVEEQMNDAIVRSCPKCHVQFLKDDGCNKMECPRCHTWICYWCRKAIPKEVGYAHFWTEQTGLCPPNMCPLWVQNATLHQNEVGMAKANAGPGNRISPLVVDNE
jgi:TRIAD3 protein (E3 ubiquitin-protein ligase RNF216)